MDTSKTGTGRRRLTSKQRQRLLAKFQQSQLAQREFANQHAIGMSTLSKWLRLERNAIPAKVKFQEVRLPIRPARQRRDVFPTHTRQYYYTDFVCNDSASVLTWRREPYFQHKDI